MSRQLWRTATFVLCGALVVAVIYHVEMTRRHHDLTTTFIADNTNAQIEQLIGPTFKDFLFDPAGDKILLFLTDETQGNHTVRAAVYVVEGSDRAMLVFEGLEWRDGYELRVRDEEGNIQTVATFASRRKLAGVAFKLPRQTPVVWEVAYAGEVLLAST